MTDSTVPDDKTLIEDCLTWIATMGSVSFEEIVRWLSGHGIDVRGDRSLKPLPDGVTWARVSERFCAVFDQIGHQVTLEQTDDICAYDGILQLRQPLRIAFREGLTEGIEETEP